MFLAEQRSIPLPDTKNIEKNNMNWNNNENNEEIFNDNYDLDLIILHRSLYIFKKKFEKYKDEFREKYKNYREIISGRNILQDEILVEQNRVPKILEDIFNLGKFGLIKYDNFKEVILNEMNFFDKIKLEEDVMSDFMEFLMENRQKYNYIFTERKLNKNFKLENYINYIPQSEDELTKIVIETENSQKKSNNETNKDNISEIVTTKNNNLEEEEEEKEKESENYNGEIIDNEENEENEEKKSEKDEIQLKPKKKLKPKTILRKSPSFHGRRPAPSL